MSTTLERTKSGFALPGFLAVVAVVALIGGLSTGSAASTYGAYDQPFFAPPSWVFGPVWTVLYVMIAVAGWLVWRQTGWGRELAVWLAQLLLNLAWTPLFFAADLLGWALVEIVILWLAIAATIVAFWRVSRVAAWLLLPYLAWVTFAAALNAAIWRLN